MRVAVLAVGDEILAGDVVNTNATWLAQQLAARGASVERMLVVPDDREVIAEYVRDWHGAFDAVVTTGGLGGTHDDVTMDAVASALDRPLELHEGAREAVAETAAAFAESNPDLVERYELHLDLDALASLPRGARALVNDPGLSPGCAVENVYVLPGIPREMTAMFETVAEEFGGDVVSETLATPVPEGAITDSLDGVRERFDVAVGSYPASDEPNRVKLTGTDPEEVRAAVAWLREHVDVLDEDER